MLSKIPDADCEKLTLDLDLENLPVERSLQLVYSGMWEKMLFYSRFVKPASTTY